MQKPKTNNLNVCLFSNCKQISCMGSYIGIKFHAFVICQHDAKSLLYIKWEKATIMLINFTSFQTSGIVYIIQVKSLFLSLKIWNNVCTFPPLNIFMQLTPSSKMSHKIRYLWGERLAPFYLHPEDIVATTCFKYFLIIILIASLLVLLNSVERNFQT